MARLQRCELKYIYTHYIYVYIFYMYISNDCGFLLIRKKCLFSQPKIKYEMRGPKISYQLPVKIY